MAFDVDGFMNQMVEESNSTQMVNVPAGEYVGTIEGVKLAQWQSAAKGTEGLKLQYLFSTDDAAVTKVVGRSPVKVRGEIMLDLTDAGSLDFGKGKNVNLGKLREACNLNRPGEKFGFPMLEGRLIKAKIGQRPDKNNPEVQYDEIKAVTKP